MHWSKIRFLGNSKIVKQNYIWIFLIPALIKVLQFPELESRAFLILAESIVPFVWYLLYFTALSFALGNLIFLVFCPSIIKDFENFSEYKAKGYYLEHLNRHINELVNSRVKGFEDKLNDVQLLTKVKDIDEEATTLIEVKLSGRNFNIKNKYENKLFWMVYDESNSSKSCALVFSICSFCIGFIFLFIIFLTNLYLVTVSFFSNLN